MAISNSPSGSGNQDGEPQTANEKLDGEKSAELPPLEARGGLGSFCLKQSAGLLIIDKPVGITSFDVIRIVRKRLNTKKIGHAGTLDPFASGILLLAVGNATKALSSLLKAEKTYRTTIVFGVDSDTLDIDGKISLTRFIPDFSGGELSAELKSLLGETEQIPPQYSAVKVNGKAAYKHARNNEIVELRPKSVSLHQAEVLEFGICDSGDFVDRPYADIRITVGSGFYVRSLARDLGVAFGTTAICTALRRESVGRFAIDGAVSPDEINAKHIFSLRAADFPFSAVTLDAKQYKDFLHGRQVSIESEAAEQVSVFFENQWCGFAQICHGYLQPQTVISL